MVKIGIITLLFCLYAILFITLMKAILFASTLLNISYFLFYLP